MRPNRLIQVVKKWYLVKGYGSGGKFSVGKVLVGKKVKLELVRPPIETARRISLEEALNRDYRVLKQARSGYVNTPFCLIGAVVRIKAVYLKGRWYTTEQIFRRRLECQA